MKNVFSVRRSITALAVLMVALSLFSACKKDSIGNDSNIPAAGLMAFNLATDKSAVGIDLSGNPIVSTPLGYTNYTGGYLSIYTGTRPIKSYNSYRDSTLATSEFSFDSSKYYSLFVVGNNGVYKNIVARDNFDSLSSTSSSYVRFINAVPDSSKMTLTANEATLGGGAVAFGTVSEFLPVTGGNVNIVAKSAAGATVQRSISVENGKAYTVLLVGLPSATDSTKTVQIKFIKNAG